MQSHFLIQINNPKYKNPIEIENGTIIEPKKTYVFDLENEHVCINDKIDVDIFLCNTKCLMPLAQFSIVYLDLKTKKRNIDEIEMREYIDEQILNGLTIRCTIINRDYVQTLMKMTLCFSRNDELDELIRKIETL